MKRSEVLKLRKIIEEAVQFLADETAVRAVTLHPTWEVGTAYDVGYKVQRNGKLYKCKQAHTAIVTWEPENTASLWEVINETHTGTLDDPIPYDGNMALVSGLHYVQNDVVYLCIRDTGNPVFGTLESLIGLYVEEV